MTVSWKSNHYDGILFEHLLTEITDFAIFMIDTDGKFVTWNPGVERLLGFSEEDFLGKPFMTIFMPDDRYRGIPEAELERARNDGRAEDDRWHRRADGTTFWASGMITRVSEGDKILGFVKIIRDLTDKRKLATTISENAQKLASANKELMNFAGIVSHDLQAPIQTMLGFASLAEQQVEAGDTAIQESLGRIIEGAKQMKCLVEGILDLTVNVEGTAECGNINSDAALATAITNLDAVIQDTGTKITFDSLPDVRGDETQLTRVFQNVIENGIKYARQDVPPEIDIGATTSGDEVRFTIRDNGIGISESDREKVFNLFERVNDEKPGHGLGLAVCRKIIERMGGRIELKSKVGSGTAFGIYLPRAVIDAQSLPEMYEATVAASN